MKSNVKRMRNHKQWNQILKKSIREYLFPKKSFTDTEEFCARNSWMHKAFSRLLCRNQIVFFNLVSSILLHRTTSLSTKPVTSPRFKSWFHCWQSRTGWNGHSCFLFLFGAAVISSLPMGQKAHVVKTINLLISPWKNLICSLQSGLL